jgi:hypothetical protein
MPRVDQPFALDGYMVTDLLGFGTTGEVWQARDAATGVPVALKRLWEPLSADRIARLRRETELLAEIANGHAVGVRDIRELGEGEVVLVTEFAAGGSLAALIGRRGRLHPSEVVTILGPLASLLADAHERGMRHGDITPSNVVFSADGRPMFADFGLALITGEQPNDDNGFHDPAVAAGTTPPPSADVFGLAAVGYAALTGVPPRPADATGRVPSVVELGPWVPAALASAVEAGMSTDPASRPGAERLASTVLRACSAGPVRLSGPRKTAAPAPGSEQAPRRRLPRPLAIGCVVVGALVLAALGGVGWAHVSSPAAAALSPHDPSGQPTDGSGRPVVAPSPADHSSDYDVIVNGLFRLRAQAFAKCRPALLRSVYTRDSFVFNMDHASLRNLCSQGLHVRGMRQRIEHVRVKSFSKGWVHLILTDTIPAYSIVGRGGRVVAQRTSRTQHYEMVLSQVHGQWFVSGLDAHPT